MRAACVNQSPAAPYHTSMRVRLSTPDSISVKQKHAILYQHVRRVGHFQALKCRGRSPHRLWTILGFQPLPCAFLWAKGFGRCALRGLVSNGGLSALALRSPNCLHNHGHLGSRCKFAARSAALRRGSAARSDRRFTTNSATERGEARQETRERTDAWTHQAPSRRWRPATGGIPP